MCICLGPQEGLLAAWWEESVSGDLQLQGCPLSPFTSAGWKGFGQAHGVCGAIPRGKKSIIWEDAAVVVDHTDVSILSSPPSYLLSIQSVASVTRTGLDWATTMLTLTLPAKRVMKPVSRRPALPLSTEMKTTNVSRIFPLPLRSFSGVLPPPCLCLVEGGWCYCLAQLWVIGPWMLGANQPQLTRVLAQLVRNSFQTQHYLCSKSLFHYCSCGEEVARRGGKRRDAQPARHQTASQWLLGMSRKYMSSSFRGCTNSLPSTLPKAAS